MKRRIEQLAEPVLYYKKASLEINESTVMGNLEEEALFIGAFTFGQAVSEAKQSMEASDVVLYDHLLNIYFHQSIVDMRAWFETHHGCVSPPRDFAFNAAGLKQMREVIQEVETTDITMRSSGYLVPEKSMVFYLTKANEKSIIACDSCDDASCVYREDSRVTLRVEHPKGTDAYPVKRGITLLQALQTHGYRVPSPCGGRGTCRKCAVTIRVDDGRESVLACLHVINDHTHVEGVAPTIIEPIDTAFPIHDMAALHRMTSEGLTHIVFEDNPMAKAGVGAYPFVLAIDLGTTTIRLHAWDLDGTPLGGIRTLNPQSSMGADVVSRIEHASRGGGLETLRACVVDALNAQLATLAREIGRSPADVVFTMLSGNTVMQHIVHGFPISQMGRAPYPPHTMESVLCPAASLGFTWTGGVFTFPVLAPFVGGDVVAGLLALDETQGTTLYIDLGTNGEIALLHDQRIYVASTAAGPAFEGGNITCGIGGIHGAVYDVKINECDFTLMYEGDKPLGFNGSGCIALLARLRELGIVDKMGRLTQTDAEGKFVVSEDLYITQEDVREIQLAKAAIRAGIQSLIRKANIAVESVEHVVLSGALGNRLNAGDMARIGLLDKPLTKHINLLANAPLIGMHALLGHTRPSNALTDLKERVVAITLTQNPDFMETYVDSMHFVSYEGSDDDAN